MRWACPVALTVWIGAAALGIAAAPQDPAPATRPAATRPAAAVLAAELRNDQIAWMVYLQKDGSFTVDGHYPPYIFDPGGPTPRKGTAALALDPTAGLKLSEVGDPLLEALDRDDAWVAAHVLIARHFWSRPVPDDEQPECPACVWDDVADPTLRRNGTPQRGALPARFVGLRVGLRVPADDPGGWSDNIDLPTEPEIDHAQRELIRAFWQWHLNWQLSGWSVVPASS